MFQLFDLLGTPRPAIINFVRRPFSHPLILGHTMSQTAPTDGSADGPSVDRQYVDNRAADSPPAGSPKVDNRRKFIRGSSLLIASALPAAGLAVASGTVSAAASSTSSQPLVPSSASTSLQQREVKLGLIGCGFRGTNVISSLLASQPEDRRWQLTAVADAFPDRMQQALRGLKGKFPQQVAVDSEARCLGLSGYQLLFQQDVDLVILATPPAFRPEHFEAAVAAGKHVYAEKPIAVDVEGVRRFQAANLRAVEQGLVVSVGWPRHQQSQFYATLDQLRGGAIGRIVSARAFQNVRPPNSATSNKPQAERDSQAERAVQLRNWTRHSWASGGPSIEPQVHNLDTMNWLLGAHPVAARPAGASALDGIVGLEDFCNGNGQTADRGHNQPVEFLYADGVSLLSYCQLVEAPQPARRVLTVHGTRGHCDLIAGKIFDSAGRLTWRAPQIASDGGQFDALIDALGNGSQFNQVDVAVEATLTAILGRTANSLGQRVEWNEVA